MNFHDIEHDFATLSFHGIEDMALDSCSDTKVLDAISIWKSRDDIHASGISSLQLENTRGFFIDYQGSSSQHWPDEKSNMLGESLVREYLFSDGICSLGSDTIRLVKIKYSVMAGEYGTEYLLICPVTTHSNNIAGLSIVCTNKYVRQ